MSKSILLTLCPEQQMLQSSNIDVGSQTANDKVDKTDFIFLLKLYYFTHCMCSLRALAMVKKGVWSFGALSLTAESSCWSISPVRVGSMAHNMVAEQNV